MALPSLSRLSAGLYSLLREKDKVVLREIGKKNLVLVDNATREVLDVLVTCKLSIEGVLLLHSCAYLLPTLDKKVDLCVYAYPERKEILDTSPQRCKHISIIGCMKGDILIRCNLISMLLPPVVEGIEDVKERAGCFLLSSPMTKDISLLAYAYLIQSCVPLTESNYDLVCKIRPEYYRQRYKCIQARQKHDASSLEATCAPYDYYCISSLVKRGKVMAKNDIIPDGDRYIRVSACANPYLCLLRRSICATLTEESVYEFKNRAESMNVQPQSAGMQMGDKRQWKIAERKLIEVERILLSDPSEVALMEIVVLLQLPRGWKKDAMVCIWSAKNILKYVTDVLLAHRMKKRVK